MRPRLFIGIGGAAVLRLRSEGLHDLELRVLGDGVIDAGSPGLYVFQQIRASPTVRRAVVRAVSRIEVFNPRIPRFRRRKVGFAVGQLAEPDVGVFRVDRVGILVVDALVFTEEVPFLSEIDRAVSAPDIVRRILAGDGVADGFVVYRRVRRAVEGVVVDADGALIKEAFQFAVTGLDVVQRAFLEFAVPCRGGEFAVVILELRAVKGVAVLVAGSVAQDVVVAAGSQVRIAAQAVADVGAVYVEGRVRIGGSGRVAAETLVVRADAEFDIGPVVDIGIRAEADAVVPGIVIIQSGGTGAVPLVLIAETGVACQLHVADTVFQIGNANAEAVQFVGEFVGQFVDHGPLFDSGPVLVRHGFGHDFGGFITGDVAVAFKVRTVNTLDDARFRQGNDGLVSPTVCRHVAKGIGGESARCADCHRCC